ncbi:DUF2182 domain-containing protein [Allosalinactinospora lopnorensis]|uniref:DUF2182 domain-containing protein n=1 Tax=Allosalinactinospora lopnorensis TaxID=1352348 RepID=UPI000623E47E|nr:DUF2182 domain-containing protein [Allosalinactinospora lopnorensis]
MTGHTTRRVRPESTWEAALVAGLLGLAALAWVTTGRLADPHMRLGLLTGVGEMMPMHAGGGPAPAALGLFLATWVIMMAAMMFPSVLPVVVTYDRWVARTDRPRAATVLFVSGYLLVWSAAGLLAYTVIVHLVPLLPSGDTAVRLGAALLVLTGLYQFTPLKRACLRQCRSPLAFIAEHAARLRSGGLAGVRTGAVHGGYCLGCCWALMVVLVLLGVMSLAWMALVAGVILLEKTLPHGWPVSGIVGGALMAAGVLLLIGAPTLPTPA